MPPALPPRPTPPTPPSRPIALTRAQIIGLIREILGECEDFQPWIAPGAVIGEHRIAEDLGVDSVALLDLVAGLESRLGRAVDESALVRLSTVGAIAEYLASLD